jgi:hypothetical protein
MIKCVFSLCKAEYSVTPSLPDMLIPTHPLKGPSWAPSMTCPASLMVYPLSDEAKQRLVNIWGELRLARHKEKKARENKPSNGDGAGKSQPLNGDHDRNAPGNHSTEWHLGGRADEDIIPDATKYTRPPLGVLGQPLGRAEQAMASMSDILAQVASAINASEVSMAGMDGVKVEIQRARAGVAELMGESQSGTLQDWMAHLNTARDAVDSIQHSLMMGKELGETFARNIQA